MYSKKDWGGPHDVYIDFALTSEQKEGWVAVVVFEYHNVNELGKPITNNADELRYKYICDDQAVAADMCSEDQLGTFLLRDSSDSSSWYAPIVTQKIDLSDPQGLHYNVEKTGYYCVSTHPSDANIKYKGVVVYQNAFGYLAASKIPQLAFFGGAALAYLLVLALWMFQYFQHRSDILPVQNYITAIAAFLVIEMIVVWGYYDLANAKGSGPGVTVYLAFTSVVNSFRNAFTFFLLLIVCLGYGVVRPSLGPLMWKCRALAGAHFVFGVVYSISSYVVSPDTAGPVVLLVIMPMSLTMTAFYVWILSSLTGTIRYLEERKQQVKANMYKNLWRILLGSIVVIFGFFFLNSLLFAQESTIDFVTNHWKSRWFLLDGWLNVVYFIDFCLIAFIWRPTANNMRFAMSSQLAQDENAADEFEIGSLRDSLDEEQTAGAQPLGRDSEESLPEFNRRDSRDENPFRDPPAQSKAKAADSKSEDAASSAQNASSSTPAGETVFNVADDDDDGDKSYDKWDDDEILSADDDDDDADESKGVKRKPKKGSS